MKKIITAILAVAMLCSMSMTAFAAPITATGDQTHDVTGKYIPASTPADVYSVILTWSAMEYNFTAPTQTWNADTHQWVDNGAGTWSGSEKQITVDNHSSTAITVAYKFTDDVEDSDTITGTFWTVVGNTQITEAVTLAKPEPNQAPTMSAVSLLLNGNLTKTDANTTDYTKIGTVTVTIG